MLGKCPLRRFSAVHQCSRKFFQCQDARLWWFLKRWKNYLILHALPSQSSKALDPLETNAVGPRISSQKLTWFSSSFCSLHSWKLNLPFPLYQRNPSESPSGPEGLGHSPLLEGLKKAKFFSRFQFNPLLLLPFFFYNLSPFHEAVCMSLNGISLPWKLF